MCAEGAALEKRLAIWTETVVLADVRDRKEENSSHGEGRSECWGPRGAVSFRQVLLICSRTPQFPSHRLKKLHTKHKLLSLRALKGTGLMPASSWNFLYSGNSRE